MKTDKSLCYCFVKTHYLTVVVEKGVNREYYLVTARESTSSEKVFAKKSKKTRIETKLFSASRKNLY